MAHLDNLDLAQFNNYLIFGHLGAFLLAHFLQIKSHKGVFIVFLVPKHISNYPHTLPRFKSVLNNFTEITKARRRFRRAERDRRL